MRNHVCFFYVIRLLLISQEQLTYITDSIPPFNWDMMEPNVANIATHFEPNGGNIATPTLHRLKRSHGEIPDVPTKVLKEPSQLLHEEIQRRSGRWEVNYVPVDVGGVGIVWEAELTVHLPGRDSFTQVAVGKKKKDAKNAASEQALARFTFVEKGRSKGYSFFCECRSLIVVACLRIHLLLREL